MTTKQKRFAFHFLFWVFAILYSIVEDYNYYPHWKQNSERNLLNILCFLPVVYLNLYSFIPKLLFTRKYVVYGVVSLLTIAASSFIISRINYLVLTNTFYLDRYGFFILLRDNLQLFVFTTAVKFIKHWYQNDKQIKELKNNNLQSELSLLKSQINPHFLFNTLNSIYYLIGKKPAKGQEAVLKLSELLSHQLYDNKRDKIELQKEVENLKNYISLEEIRYQDSVVLEATYSPSINGEMIAPMLLLPLVENAFKHGHTTAGKCYISLAIGVENGELHFHCKNSIHKKPNETSQKGIGLHSVKRRLTLLYPGKHFFHVATSDEFYSVDLKLKLNEG